MKDLLKITISCLSLMLACFVSAAQDEVYTFISSNRPVTIESGTRTVDIEPGKKYSKKLYPDDFIYAGDGSAKLEIGTPYGTGKFSIPSGRKYKVMSIVTSAVFSLPPKDDYWAIATEIWDLFMHHDEKKTEYYKRMEYGGIKMGTGTKKGSYDKPDVLPPNEKLILKKMKDSLQEKGVSDSAIYYLKEAFFLERTSHLMLAGEKYERALQYAKKNDRDTAILHIINVQFDSRVKNPKKEKQNDFFK